MLEQQFRALEYLVLRSPDDGIIAHRAECAGSGRLVGAFLSVCALTVLCGLVLVALTRLVLQRRSRSAEGTHEDRDFQHTGKVRSLLFSSLFF